MAKSLYSTLLEIKPSAVKLLIALCGISNDAGRIENITLAELGSITRMSKPTLIKARRELENARLLKVQYPSTGATGDDGYTPLVKILAPYISSIFNSIKASKEVNTYSQKKDNTGQKTLLDKSDSFSDIGEEILFLREATKIVGVNLSSQSPAGLRARRLARARMREGATRVDLLQVCRYAMIEYDKSKFHNFRLLTYIWRSGIFETILECKGERRSTGVYRGMKGKELEEWAKSRTEQIRIRNEKMRQGSGQS